MAKAKLTWITLSDNPDATSGIFMGTKGLKAWQALKTAEAAFEKSIADQLAAAKAVPDGQVVKFGYNYGRPSFAFAEKASEVASVGVKFT